MYIRIHTGEKHINAVIVRRLLTKNLILQSISRYIQWRNYSNAAIVRYTQGRDYIHALTVGTFLHAKVYL